MEMMFDAMMQHYDESRENLELIMYMYFEVGPTTKKMRMGDTIAELLHQTFGTSKQFWLNMENAWLTDKSQPYLKDAKEHVSYCMLRGMDPEDVAKSVSSEEYEFFAATWDDAIDLIEALSISMLMEGSK
jgi:hypothetical protein